MPLFLLLLLSSADAVYLQHTAAVELFGPDSGYTETTREVMIPLTARGVRRYGTISTTYRNTWETVEIDARIAHWRPGRGDSEAEIHEEPHSSLLPGGMLESSLREVYISFPGIEIGDTIKVEITRRIRRLPLGDFYSFTYYSSSRDSIHQGSFSVAADPGIELHTATSGGGFLFRDYTGADGLRHLAWESGPRVPIPLLPFSPDPVFQSPRVTVASHLPDQVSSGLYRSLVEECLHGVPGPGDSLMEAAGNEPSELRSWVAAGIEYLSGEWGSDPGYTPRSPIETLNDRAGVCRDRAVLLIWLLRGAGLEPFAVLSSYSAPVGPYPGSRSFDHMLVAIEESDGDTLFLDPTNLLSPDGYTYTLRGREYLPLTPEGAPLARFPDPSGGDTLEIEIEGGFVPGSAVIRGRISVEFSGAAEELFRSMLSSVDVSGREELLRRLFRALPGSTISLSGDPASPGEDMGVCGTAEWEYGMLRTGDSTVIILPGLSGIDLVGSRATAYLLPPFRERVFVETPYAARMRISLVDLPSGTPSLPDPVQMDNYSLRVELEGDTLVLCECMSLLPSHPDQPQTLALREGALACISSSHRTVTFR
ncbi:MAG: DUF3857 domain-containing protein [Candidatus Fermentibacteraceae bacterium]|nr:DUF3857 domain-containing protein [Candidatus Fermentibacteraceae bacterium]